MKALEDILKRFTINPVFRVLGRRIEQRHFSDIPIVICACPRSGTTLLQAIMDVYPRVHAIHRQTYAFASWKKRSMPDGDRYLPDRLDRW